jgi:hypothetical protein
MQHLLAATVQTLRAVLADNEDKVAITEPHPLITETKQHQTAASNLRVTESVPLLGNKWSLVIPAGG